MVRAYHLPVATPPPSELPPPPPAGGTHDDWREWRRQRRLYAGWGWGAGSFFWPVVLILIGAYYLLKDLGLLGFIRTDIFWPSLLILFGLWLLISRAMRRPL